jgi:hypothetical protein
MSAGQMMRIQKIGRIDGRLVLKHFSKTMSFLETAEKMGLSFSMLVKSDKFVMCRTLGARFPMTLFYPFKSKDHYYWHGIPNLPAVLRQLGSKS